MSHLSPGVLQEIVGSLRLAVFVFRQQRLLYANTAAKELEQRLRATDGIELTVILRDALRNLGAPKPAPVTSLITSPSGQPFYLHVGVLRGARGGADRYVTVRQLGIDREAVTRSYGLSNREGQVVDLVLRGYTNQDIARSLGIAVPTAKKHLTRVFDKIGVDSRSQLISRLA
jgi:DNA-binding CsgD family transcriptional regulator